jgi:hypothetical protein
MSKFGWVKLGTLILLVGVMAAVVAVNESGVLDAETATGENSGLNSAPAGADRPGGSLEECTPGVEFVGFSDALNKTAFGGFDVNELSAITYDPARRVYYSVADRGGPIESHFFTIHIPVTAGTLGIPRVQDVKVLKEADGNSFDGSTFDGEGIVVTHQMELIIASEGGSGPDEQPEIRRFSLVGEHLGELPVPSRFLIGSNNQSFESLALSPNGRSLFTITEGPLAADGSTDDLRSRLRIIHYERRGPDGFKPIAEYFYLTEPGRAASDVGAAEMLALSEHDLLVLERGFVAGQGNTIRIFRVSVKSAPDVSNQPTLDAPDLAPVAKNLVVDVANCPSAGATSPQVQPNPLLDNYEAMALGPGLEGGRRSLVLLSDDNGNPSQVTRVVALAIPTRDLVGEDDDDD